MGGKAVLKMSDPHPTNICDAFPKPCVCAGVLDKDGHGGSDCSSTLTRKDKKLPWCYVKTGACKDGAKSKTVRGHDWSAIACPKQQHHEPGIACSSMRFTKIMLPLG